MTGRQPRLLVLDNEAVQALGDPTHRRHRHAVALVEVTVGGGRRRAGPAPVVPTAVRVEAGWDRRVPRAAAINRFQVVDVPLDADSADRAAAVRGALNVSVADAHLGATMATIGRCTVVTSDADDMRRIAGHLVLPVTVVAL